MVNLAPSAKFYGKIAEAIYLSTWISVSSPGIGKRRGFSAVIVVAVFEVPSIGYPELLLKMQ